MRILLAFLFCLSPVVALADTLMWDAPTTRTDGTPLSASELKEYRVYNNEDLLGPVTAPATEFLVEVSGDYKFAVTAVDTEGRESEKSDFLSVTVRSRPGKPGKLLLKVG